MRVQAAGHAMRARALGRRGIAGTAPSDAPGPSGLHLAPASLLALPGAPRRPRNRSAWPSPPPD